MPVPVRFTDCGEPEALSAMLIEVLSDPSERGANVTVIVQVAPAATVVQLLDTPKALAFVPPTVTAVTLRGALPEFVKVMACEAVVPSAVFGKAIVLGDKLTAGAGGTAVPVSAMVWEVPDSVPVMLSVPENVPVAVGAKVTITVQVAKTGNAEVQLFVSEKSEAFAPLNDTEEKLMTTLPVFLTVTFWVDVSPDGTLLNESDAGLAVAAEAAAVFTSFAYPVTRLYTFAEPRPVARS
jgi:hypothetical protein